MLFYGGKNEMIKIYLLTSVCRFRIFNLNLFLLFQALTLQANSDVCRLKVANSDAVVCDEKLRVNVVAAE